MDVNESDNIPTIRRGANGCLAAELQTRLNDAMGAGLTVDGVFGKKTEETVKAFQAYNGLKADGVVGPKTWAALERATGHDADGMDLTVDKTDTVAIGKSDWNAIRAAYAAISGIIRKYENVR